ncbi:MAG: serine hydrolase [Pseudomonadota bacterium]
MKTPVLSYLPRKLLVPVLSIMIAGLSTAALAQNVTIAGTEAGDSPTGFTAMFSGDRYENFRHMGRFVSTSTMPAAPQPWDLGPNRDSLTFTGEFLGEPKTLKEFIELSNTSSFLVLKDGEVVYEHYAHGDTRDSLHISFSVAKSFTSALVGIALGEGKIKSLDDPIRGYLPELTSDTFDDVTIKQVLQMSSGMRFTEVYTDPESDINRMSAKVPPMTYLEYVNTLPREHSPGTFNHYASINTQLLGILLVRVTGESVTNYMTSRLWHPLGMKNQGHWIMAPDGIELVMGGLSASARDYAKLGLLYLNDGKRGNKRLLPKGWVEESVTPDQPHLMPGENPKSSNVSGYQYQWWTPREWDEDYLARGIWGQNIYVHPRNGVVIVKLAADQKNFNSEYKLAYIDYLQDLAQSFDN